jgi:protein gp37
MGKNSDIEWTHHTFNAWWGCDKVSPACVNCYAETWAKRTGFDIWGKTSVRRVFGESHWKEPVKWNLEAGKRGVKERVFCSSMADVFEDRPELKAEREKLWELIKSTPNLIWLLLTKRPQNILKMAPWAKDNVWPENIWLGATVENQAWAEKRLPHLLKHKSAVRFLSCEPLLGALDLSIWHEDKAYNPISWVIAGGESGAKSRPMSPSWLTGLRDYCEAKDIAFHFKQWGHWVPVEMLPVNSEEKKPQQFKLDKPMSFVALGKKGAGRILEGRTHDDFPASKKIA